MMKLTLFGGRAHKSLSVYIQESPEQVEFCIRYGTNLIKL